MVNVVRGDVVLCDINPVVGTEQAGIIAVAIIQIDRVNAVSPHTIITPFTSKINWALLPSHVFVPAGVGGLSLDSVILCEQVRVIDKSRIMRKLGHRRRFHRIFRSYEEFQTEDVGIDTITDFSQTQGDIILLDLTTFNAINSESGRGFSIPSEFATVTNDEEAANSDAVIVYNSENGNLFYNPNGSQAGFGSGGQFATLTNTPLLETEDFLLRG